jgi:hypothetical protein
MLSNERDNAFSGTYRVMPSTYRVMKSPVFAILKASVEITPLLTLDLRAGMAERKHPLGRGCSLNMHISKSCVPSISFLNSANLYRRLLTYCSTLLLADMGAQKMREERPWRQTPLVESGPLSKAAGWYVMPYPPSLSSSRISHSLPFSHSRINHRKFQSS